MFRNLVHRTTLTIAAVRLTVLTVAASVTPHLAQAADASACQTRSFEGSAFIVCIYTAATDELRLAATGADGAPLKTFDGLKHYLGSDAARVKFAMNAGMYDDDDSPHGLYVENGRTRTPLRTDDGEGNFYLKPNGVFWVGADGAPRVETTDSFRARHAAPKWATQSGPMLVIDGALHPQIQPDGPSQLIRNGVGVRDDHTAMLVISQGPVSFGRFARFFRDELHCRNALFLDGTISSLWAPGLGRKDGAHPMGPMVVVMARR